MSSTSVSILKCDACFKEYKLITAYNKHIENCKVKKEKLKIQENKSDLRKNTERKR